MIVDFDLKPAVRYATHPARKAAYEVYDVQQPNRSTIPTVSATTKKVRFLPYVTSYRQIAVENYNPSERWYSAKDYADFRSDITNDSNRYQELNPESIEVIQTIMKACLTASEYTEHNPTTLASAEGLSHWIQPQLEKVLQESLQDNPYLIGLHKFCAHELIQDKIERRHEILDAVLTARTTTPWISTNMPRTVPVGTCQSISLPCRLFAEVMGRVVAQAS